MRKWRIGTDDKGLDVSVSPSLLLVGCRAGLIGIADYWRHLGGAVIFCHSMIEALTKSTRPHAMITQQGLAVEPYPQPGQFVTAEDEDRDTPPFSRGPRVARELVAKWPEMRALVLEVREAAGGGGVDVIPSTNVEAVREWMRKVIATSEFRNGGK